MSHEDNWDYEAEARMAFDIMSAEARTIERRGFDSEAAYQKQVSRIDNLLSKLLTYRALKAEALELTGEATADPSEEDLCIRAAQYWLEPTAQANYDALRFLSTPQPARPTLGEMEAEDLTPYLRELDRAVAEAARFLMEDALEAEAEENEPGEDVS